MNIAVIGSGISGCAAAWELSSWANKVTVFESGERLGGHTHTQNVSIDGTQVSVDTGFIVFNHRTYPGLKKWFELLGVDTAPSDMSFSASLNQGQIEWCGTNLNTVFAQRKNLLSPKFWAMLKDILRFNREAPLDAAKFRLAINGGPSLGEYLDRQGYGKLFLDAYLLPMAGAIWSCPTEQMRAFPMATFTRFCENHGLLSVSNRPQWYTVRNGAANYLRCLQNWLATQGRQVEWKTAHHVTQVLPQLQDRGGRSGVRLDIERHASGQQDSFTQDFDAVVIACHSDQAHQLLPKAHALSQIAGRVRYQDNVAILHTDTALMPKRKTAWASWNYIHDAEKSVSTPSVSVTYWMNRLQPLPVQKPVLVSLNPVQQPAADQIINTMHYAHPIFDGPAVTAQRELEKVQGTDSIWLAGAWTRYGFHEDGFQSGVNAARGVKAQLDSARKDGAPLQQAA
ncbi:FAD-dependent oxidoreductase [beta proteobacterium MWH-UniP1]